MDDDLDLGTSNDYVRVLHLSGMPSKQMTRTICDVLREEAEGSWHLHHIQMVEAAGGLYAVLHFKILYDHEHGE